MRCGGRYDGLIETLGGPHTPAVGWAAGIERLAMLVGELADQPLAAALVVEDDEEGSLSHATHWLHLLRGEGFSVEMFASGSPRKRYDKAVKRSPTAILKFSKDGHGLSHEGDADPRMIELLRSF
jgi:histidyl-tRNA synthetase